MKIIALSGKAESGKNFYAHTIKTYIEHSFNEKVCLIAFADVLKYTCKTYFGWDGEKDEKGRKLLQEVGTELREKNSPDIWVNITCELIKLMSSKYEWFIITDVRFERELLALELRFSHVYPVRIDRFEVDVDYFEDNAYRATYAIKPYVNHLTEAQQNHSSETELDNYKDWYEIIYNYTVQTCNEDVDCSADEPMYNIFKLINRIRKETENESI